MWLLATIIASAAWAAVNILDSALTHRYERRPYVLLWCDALVRFPIVMLLIVITDLPTPALRGLLLLAGIIFCLGAYLYLFLLRYVDASVTQCAWAIEAIFLSIAGFWLFKEIWTPMQAVGSLIIFAAVCLISFWHMHISFVRTVGLLTLIAAATAPGNILIKYALQHGTTVLACSAWAQLGMSVTALLLPSVSRQARSHIRHRLQVSNSHFWGSISLLTGLIFVGSFFTNYAFAVGPLSLVAVASNAQIFLVVLFAWLLLKLRVPCVPKELLTRQSVTVKLIGFALMTVGVGLLG